MKIEHLEATNMGSDQQEIADKVMEYVYDMEFEKESDFWEIEGSLIYKACKELEWDSVPQCGGLEVYWKTKCIS